MGLFGFMDLMIFVKWTTDWDAYEKVPREVEPGVMRREIAPGIIQTMITMFIKMGVKAPLSAQ